MVVGVAVKGADTASVAATVTPGEISVTVDPTTFDYGTMPLNTSKTSYTAIPGKITATVGSVNTDLDIKGANADGATTGVWTLAGTTGVDTYVHGFGLGTTDPGTYTNLTTTYQDMASVTADGTQDFGLKITTPTSSTVMEQYTVPVTVLASWGG